MPPSETDTLPSGGTDSAQPSTNFDNPASWDYYDPDEEKQDTVTPAKATGTEGEQAENVEDVQEADVTEEQQEEPDATADGQKPQAKAVAPDEAEVEMPDGSKLTVADLKRGNMLQSHYTRTRQTETRALSEKMTHLDRTIDAVSKFIEGSIPPPPDMRLSVTDPQAYLAQQVQHDAARRQWQEILSWKDVPQQISQEMQAEQHEKVLRTENELLVERIPTLKEPKARNEFMQKALDVAKKAGVSEDEFRTFTDHRYFVVLDYAIKGMAAEKNMQIARQKVAQVPPVTPPKRQSMGNTAATQNRDAMRNLSKTGSIKDAMMVDFD